MILNKILKICAALAVPGLGLFAACSSDDNVASSFSETNTGKPVEQLGLLAELDTSLVHKKISGENICVDSVDDELYEGPMLVKKKDPEVRDSSVIKGGRVMCRPHKDIYLFMDARTQVVDAKGNPMAFVKVYEGVCGYDDPKCQYTTDKDGYFYMDSVNYLTYWENDFAEDVKHMADLGFKQISVEPVVAPPEMDYSITQEDVPKLLEQYDILADEMLKRRKEGDPFNFFHFMIDLECGPCVYKRLSGCGSGTEYLAVTPWGDLYPCHQFVGDEEYLMGNLYDGVTNTEMREKFRKCNIYSRPDCADCWAKLYCSGGCAANAYHATGDITGIYEPGCRLFRKRIECAIMMQIANADFDNHQNA